ncbi:hypothetical protein F4861DRAFT_505184 [Xylaria intraflava]|nr:hypothetical protein F4861DRAFT_505184 [Xylaria intraflava]
MVWVSGCWVVFRHLALVCPSSGSVWRLLGRAACAGHGFGYVGLGPRTCSAVSPGIGLLSWGGENDIASFPLFRWSWRAWL